MSELQKEIIMYIVFTVVVVLIDLGFLLAIVWN